MVLWQMFENIFEPWSLLFGNSRRCFGVFYLPFIDELVQISNFSCHWWNSCSSKGPVILISSDCNAHYLFRCSFHRPFLKWRFLRYLRKYALNPWPPLFNIVFIAPIKWIDESISIGMHINNKGELVLFALHKITICDRFRFWKWLLAWIIVATRIKHSHFLSKCLWGIMTLLVFVAIDILHLSKINSKISIYVDSRVLALWKLIFAKAAFMILIFPFPDYFMWFLPIIFNKWNSINVQCRKEVISILSK